MYIAKVKEKIFDRFAMIDNVAVSEQLYGWWIFGRFLEL